MKKEITLFSLLGILSAPLLLIFTWGMSITTRLSTHDEILNEHKSHIESIEIKVEKTDDKIDENYKLMSDKIDLVIYKLDEKESKR